MKVVAFGASSSKNSINQKLANYAATYAATKIPHAEVKLIDINDFEMPLFSEDREKELGSPQLAQDFFKLLGEADVLVISFAEHNGSYTAAYKNLFDWTSRVNMKLFQNKPIIMLSTSPGPGGANNVLTTASNSAPYFDGDVKASLSLPSFYDNFDMETQSVTLASFNEELASAIQSL